MVDLEEDLNLSDKIPGTLIYDTFIHFIPKKTLSKEARVTYYESIL